MKQTLLNLLFLFSCSLGAIAQITVTNSTFPEVGDTLLTAVDNIPSNIVITPAGPDQSWSYVNLEAPFNRSSVLQPAEQGPGAYAFPSADYYTEYTEGVVAYYKVSNNKVEIIGLYGEDPIGLGLQTASNIEPALPVRRAPMNFLDVNQVEYDVSVPIDADDLPTAILENFPITPDSLRVRANVSRLDVVDAWGTLTIPGGIYDVLREKRTEYREVRLDAKIGIFDWYDVTDIALEFLPLENLGQDTSISYHFISNETIEPIAIVEMNNDETIVERVEFKANTVTSSLQTLSDLKPGVYAFPNPAIVSVRFEFTDLPSGKYKLKILNILGIEVWSHDYRITGNHTEKVDISALRKGTYLYSLSDEKGKIITTRRLVVVRP
ncbi:MAG: T9SS type A sorting domain-containing protein [Chitinophagales bacterium]|nr:T9SS type A sorting domain-containing protein [Chitinophagales bacterium]